jgi:S-formylglutathione hydrolase FrmB
MPRIWRYAVAIGLLLSVTTTARQPAPRPAGSIVIQSVSSTGLKANLLGDPAERNAAVYLPPSYNTTPSRRYPTLYLLHGYLSNLQVWGTRDGVPGYQGMQLAPTLDALIAGGLPELIVVAPNARNAYFGSFYANSAVTGAWEDFIVRDLVSWVDANFRMMPGGESRGIAGHSMGGYGAIMLAMKHPDVFGALYALSPCCVGMEGDLSAENPAWAAAQQIRSRDQLQPRPRSIQDFYVIAMVAMAAALSPNPAKPPMYIDLPFEEKDGTIAASEPARASWRAKMPLYLVDEYAANLRKLRGIAFDYGALEEFSHIQLTTRAFSGELSRRAIAHRFEIYPDGNHENRIRQRLETRVLPFFAEVLRGQ